MNTLQRYKAGLLFFGLLTIVLLIVVLMQASSAKQDNITDRKANDIATKLDDYITNKQEVPDSLSTAGINDVPATITYKKLGDDSYKFCATYKAASSDFANSTVVEDAIYQGITGTPSASDSYDTSGYDDTSGNTDSSYLYISPTHKKGENCQTITSAIYSSYDDSTSADPNTDANGVAISSDPKEASINAGVQDSICYLNGFKTHYSGIITSAATTDGKPVETNTTQVIVLKVTPDAGSNVKGEQTINVTSSRHSALSGNCDSLARSELKVGDYIAIFSENSDGYSPDVIADYSRN